MREGRQRSLLDGSFESPSANETSEAEHLVLPALLFTAKYSTSHHPDTILSSLLSFPSGVWTMSFLTIDDLVLRIATMTPPGAVARRRTTWMKGECRCLCSHRSLMSWDCRFCSQKSVLMCNELFVHVSSCCNVGKASKSCIILLLFTDIYILFQQPELF